MEIVEMQFSHVEFAELIGHKNNRIDVQMFRAISTSRKANEVLALLGGLSCLILVYLTTSKGSKAGHMAMGPNWRSLVSPGQRQGLDFLSRTCQLWSVGDVDAERGPGWIDDR